MTCREKRHIFFISPIFEINNLALVTESLVLQTKIVVSKFNGLNGLYHYS